MRTFVLLCLGVVCFETGSAQSFDLTYLHLCRYGVFYADDAEWFTQNASAYSGSVFSNHSIYLGSQSVFDMNSPVQCAGHIYNVPKDTTLQYSGVVRIADPDSVLHELSYDSRDPNWVSRSLVEWDGWVQDSAHGILPLPYPIEMLADPIEIIKRGQIDDGQEERRLRFYYRAGLRIIDGIATDSVGNLVELPPGVITAQSIYDFREGHNMEMRNVRIDLLIAHGLVPANRMIYISYLHVNAAVRLSHASQLPEGGLLIATDNPLYVWGNWNTANKQRSVLLCDAFNQYSPNWNDANSTRSLTWRNATPTQLNTCLVTGNKETTPGNYNGGVDALIRLHERWDETNVLTFRGSLLCAWQSEQATGDFNDASFVEHHRDAAFDPDLLEVVPRAPEGLAIHRGESNDIRLLWPPVTESISGEPLDSVSYHVQASSSAMGPWQEIGTTDSTWFAHSGVIGDSVRCFYRVTASAE